MSKVHIVDEHATARLMAAVLDKAREDYINGYNGASGNRQIKSFIRSDYGKLFRGDISAEAIIDNWDIQKAHEKWRANMGCQTCPLKNSKKKNRERCIHEKRGRYTHPKKCIIRDRVSEKEENENDDKRSTGSEI